MNEWERRNLEVLQNHKDLMDIAGTLGAHPIIEYFGYTAKIGLASGGILAQNAPQQTTIIVQADAYFVLEYITTACVKTDRRSVMQDTGGINLQITDTGAGGVIYNTAFNAGIMTGTPGANDYDTPSQFSVGIPFIFPIPRIILPHTNIKIEMSRVTTEAGGAETQQFVIALMGARVTRG